MLELKRIVREVWDLVGKWSSPGGQSKKFSNANSDLVLTWHKGKLKSVLFKGRDGVLVRDQCILLCKHETQSILKPGTHGKGGGGAREASPPLPFPKGGRGQKCPFIKYTL